MKPSVWVLVGFLFGQALPLGPGLQNHAGGGGSNITTTPGGTCTAYSNGCSLDANTPGTSGTVLIVGINSDTNYTGQASACVANPGSVAMTRVQYFQSPDAGFQNIDVWALANATSGLSSVSCTLFSGTMSSIFAQWFANADPATPVDDVCTSVTGSDTNPCSLTTALANELLLAFGTFNGTAPQACTGFTTINSRNANAGSEVDRQAATAAGAYPLANCSTMAGAFLTVWIGVALK